MPGPGTPSAAKAPGQITVGVDSTGKHYKYVSGQGKRGRQPLNLGPNAAEGLRRAGLAPGRPIAVSPQQLQALAGPSGASGAVKPAAPKQKTAASPQIVSRIVASHNAWLKTGGDADQRIAHLLSNGRDKFLRSGNSDVHRALAGAVLGAVFGKNVKPGSGKTSNISVRFNPGNGKNGSGHITVSARDSGHVIGSVRFDDVARLDRNKIQAIRSSLDSATRGFKEQRSVLDAAVKQRKAAPTNHVRSELKAMKRAFAVTPEGVAKPRYGVQPEQRQPAAAKPAAAKPAAAKPAAAKPAAAKPAAAKPAAAKPAAAKPRTIGGDSFRKLLKQSGDDLRVAASKFVGDVEKHLKAGGEVHLYAGGKRVPIVAIKDGMMQDAKGQRWGTMGIATDKTGEDRVEFLKK